MTDALGAYGTTLTWNGNVIAEVRNISGPKITIDTKDVTSHSSADAHKEFIPTLVDGGEVSIEALFIPGDTDGQKAFITDAQARTSRTAIITLPTAAGATWTFTGIVTSLDFTHPAPDELGFTATIKVTGKPVLAITASTGMSALSVIEENGGGAVTPVPTFAIGTFTYSLSVNTLSDYVKFTPTAASHTITIKCGTQSEVVTSGAQSGEITLGSAGSVTTITIEVQESGKTKKTYTFYVTRP